MDINQILFLIAILNLVGDLYNIFRFRHHIPRWVPWANLSALATCISARIWLAEHAGAIALGVLVVYIALIKLKTGSGRASKAIPAAPCTKGLIVITVLAFGYQVYRGAMDDAVRMVTVGAMFSPLFESGEWWRLFSAQFLHWGNAYRVGYRYIRPESAVNYPTRGLGERARSRWSASSDCASCVPHLWKPRSESTAIGDDSDLSVADGV